MDGLKYIKQEEALELSPTTNVYEEGYIKDP